MEFPHANCYSVFAPPRRARRRPQPHTPRCTTTSVHWYCICSDSVAAIAVGHQQPYAETKRDEVYDIPHAYYPVMQAVRGGGLTPGIRPYAWCHGERTKKEQQDERTLGRRIHWILNVLVRVQRQRCEPLSAPRDVAQRGVRQRH